MSKKYKGIYIALGANLSNPIETFSAALDVLSTRGVMIKAVSALWQSPAWPPGSDQADYLNGCAEIDYAGEALDLLKLLHLVEAEFGRKRTILNAARTLDLDLLDFKGEIYGTPDIEVPHPRMLTRGFVLFPLQDIAPDWCDPKTGHKLEHFIARLPLSDIAPMQRRLGKRWYPGQKM